MSKMKRLTLQKSWRCAAVLVAVLCLSAQLPVLAQDLPPPAPGASRGENFSAKPPAALFASDCTGAGCHKGPQGLNKGQGLGGLAGFLREHYTNSRESAAALAGYLSKLPSAPEPKERARRHHGRASPRPWPDIEQPRLGRGFWISAVERGVAAQARAERGSRSARDAGRPETSGKTDPRRSAARHRDEAGRRSGDSARRDDCTDHDAFSRAGRPSAS